MGQRYFSLTEARQHSRQFYQRLLDAARTGDLDEVEAVTRTVIDRSQSLWEIAQQEAR
jgi:DNA-binding FadR family transcriptional regulator